MLMRAAAVLKTSCTIVGTAMNGRAWINAAATLQPDVIVLDVSMPGMNGLEVAASLREAGSTAALIFFTVHQAQDWVARLPTNHNFQIQMVAGLRGRCRRAPLKSLMMRRYSCGCGGSQPLIPTALYVVAA
jgi:CheY-like chemotaxis protein